MPNTPKFNIPFAAIKAAMDKNLTGFTRTSTPTFAQAVGNFRDAYARYGGRRPFSRATGIPESTLRRWEKQVAEGRIPKTSQANQDRVRGALRKVERIMRLRTETEQHLRNSPSIRLQATFKGQTERGERTLWLNKTTKDQAGFKRAADKLVTAYIAGSMAGMMDAFDDMIEAYEPDLAESYFEADAVGGIVVT